MANFRLLAQEMPEVKRKKPKRHIRTQLENFMLLAEDQTSEIVYEKSKKNVPSSHT